MSQIPGLRRIFHLAFGRRGASKDIDEEIRFHLETLIEELRAQGKTREEAEELARAEFGDVERFRAQLETLGRRKVRRQGKADLLGTLRQDLLFALRQLVRYRGFTVVAVLTLILGLGATTAIFSVVNGVLLRPFPYPTADRLVMVWSENPEKEWWTRSSMSTPDLTDVRGLDAVDFVEGYASNTFTLATEGKPLVVQGSFVTGGLLDMFGLHPEQGRDIREEENRPGSPPVVVLGHDLWMSDFGGDPGVVGRLIQIGDERYQVVGVAPRGFDFPERAELWVPHRHPCYFSRGCRNLNAIARLAPGAELAPAQAALSALASSLRNGYPEDNPGVHFRYEPLMDAVVGHVRTGLWVLLGAVGLMLLVVSANLANLLLARAVSRKEEMAVRTALGASPARLVEQLIVESLVLAGLGCAGGLGLAWGMVRAFGISMAGDFPRAAEVTLDAHVLMFALGTAGLVAALFGLSPALHLARPSTGEALKTRGDGSENPARSWLIGAEVCLSVILLTGAGLLLRSLGQLYRVDQGFRHEEALRFGLSLPPGSYGDPASLISLFQRIEDGLMGESAVVSVGSVVGPPLGPWVSSGSVTVGGREAPDPADQTYASVHAMTPGYFETLGLPLLRGRGITDADRGDGPPVAVVSEEFVQQNFPHEEALNRRVSVAVATGAGKAWTIVGVVRDTRRSLTGDPQSEVYVPLAQASSRYAQVLPDLIRSLRTLRIHVRGTTSGTDLLPLVRREVESVDRRIALTGIETVSQAMRRDAAPTRNQLQLIGFFAVLAAMLAAVGLYGVVSYMVSQREREIGIRQALGADGRTILIMVLGRGVLPAGVGAVAGLLASLLLGRLVQSLLYQVKPTDPSVLGSVMALVAIIALAATLLPARQAVKLDPATALRVE